MATSPPATSSSALTELCCTGLTLPEALEKIGVKKTKFYSQRYIVELSVVDREEYELLLSQNEKTKLLNINKLCKQRLAETHIRDKMVLLQQIGLLLG